MSDISRLGGSAPVNFPNLSGVTSKSLADITREELITLLEEWCNDLFLSDPPQDCPEWMQIEIQRALPNLPEDIQGKVNLILGKIHELSKLTQNSMDLQKKYEQAVKDGLDYHEIAKLYDAWQASNPPRQHLWDEIGIMIRELKNLP